MRRFHQLLFIVSFMALSWLAMMVVHEMGHVVGSLATGGTVKRVVIHPLTISRTDVAPNPHPAIVVWLGPLFGCALPVAIFVLIGLQFVVLKSMARFFAGFCLIANGAYISCGAFDRVGDCGEMLRTGTPLWVMIGFGMVTVSLGFNLWHGLGSLPRFLADPSVIEPLTAYAVFFACAALVAVQFAFFGS